MVCLWEYPSHGVVYLVIILYRVDRSVFNVPEDSSVILFILCKSDLVLYRSRERCPFDGDQCWAVDADGGHAVRCCGAAYCGVANL